MSIFDNLLATAMMGEGGGGGGGGSSDFSTAQVTFVRGTAEGDISILVPFVDEGWGTIVPEAYITGDTMTVNVVLYKGKCGAWPSDYDAYTLEGDIYDDEETVITGSGTITINALPGE